MIRGVIKSPITGCYVQSTGRPSLFTSVPSCIFDLDSSIILSYGGTGQIWRNLVIYSTYSFYLGRSASVSTDDPTLIGTAGTPSAYFLLDGGDCFQIPANTQFIKNWQKTTGGQAFTLVVAFRAGPIGTSYTIVATNALSTQVGLRVSVNTSGLVQLFMRGDTGSAASSSGAMPALVEGTDYILAMGLDPSTGNIIYALNSLTVSSTTLALNTTTANATGLLTIGAGSNGSSPAPNGTRVYASSVYTKLLSSSEMSAVCGVYFDRHLKSFGLYPENTVAPAISGTAMMGQTLTCSTGIWLGGPALTYQWYRNGTAIAGATTSTYVIVAADLGKTLTCTVTGAANGKTAAVSSAGFDIGSTLASVVSGVVMDLDATMAASYTSGQSWLNLIASPADGSPQSAYDVYLGASATPSTDDPTFAGSAGSPSAYFALDGGDFFRIAANTAFIKAMHKTTGGTAWTVCTVINVAATAVSPSAWATNTTSSTAGVRGSLVTGTTPRLTQRGDTASVSSDGNAITSGTDALIIMSYNPATSKCRFWVNSRAKTEASIAFNATAADPSGSLTIANAASGTSGCLPAGSRQYAFAMLNVEVDDTQAGYLIDTYNTRHGRIYA